MGLLPASASLMTSRSEGPLADAGAPAGADDGIGAIDAVLMGEGGASPDPERATHLYETAATAGSGAAAERLAVLAALGIAQPANWELALDRLAQSAALGHRPAQKQLAILADRKDLATRTVGAPVWGKVRASIDVAALLKPPALQRKSVAPAVFVGEGFATRAMCRWIIDRGRRRLARSEVQHFATGKTQPDPMRTAEAASFRLVETDLVLAVIQQRVASASNLPVHWHEPPNLLHYAAGQEYRAHFDFINPGVPGARDQLEVFGQRAATFLVYLNDDFEGGETSFPKLGWHYRGRAGDALFFVNVTPDGRPDGLTLHAGLPPVRGQKWLLSLWIRDRVQPIT